MDGRFEAIEGLVESHLAVLDEEVQGVGSSEKRQSRIDVEVIAP